VTNESGLHWLFNKKGAFNTIWWLANPRKSAFSDSALNSILQLCPALLPGLIFRWFNSELGNFSFVKV
jgi:hypothetical protein